MRRCHVLLKQQVVSYLSVNLLKGFSLPSLAAVLAARSSLLMWTFTISRDFNNCRFLSLRL